MHERPSANQARQSVKHYTPIPVPFTIVFHNGASGIVLYSHAMFHWPEALSDPLEGRAIDHHRPLASTDDHGSRDVLDRAGDGVECYALGTFDYDPSQLERLTLATRSCHARESAHASERNSLEGWHLREVIDNSCVVFTIPIRTGGGTFNVRVESTVGNDRGRYQLSAADRLHGSYANLGTIQDLYAAANASLEADLGVVHFASGGVKYFKFSLMGKNDLSAHYALTLDYLKLTKQ